MKRSEYKKAVREKLFTLLCEGAMVDDLVEGIEQVNDEVKMSPPEIRTYFVCTNGKRKIAYVNRWTPEDH